MVNAVNLSPPTLDISGVRAGDANEFFVTLTQSGAPLDLTDAVLTAQARRSSGDATALDAVVEVLDAPAGRLKLAWPGDAVRDLLDGAEHWNGVWDLQLESGGSTRTLLAGKFAADLDVTRAEA